MCSMGLYEINPSMYGVNYNYQAPKSVAKNQSQFCFGGSKMKLPNYQKVGFWEGTKAFFKGLVKPLKNMIQHPFKSLLTMGAMAALIVGTGGAATPLLIGAGLAMGTYQVGKGAYNFFKSNNRWSTLMALENMGEGTFTLGASVAGAKAYASSIKGASAASASTENTGIVSTAKSLANDCLTTIKDIPANAKATYNTIASGKILTNIQNIRTHGALMSEKSQIDAMAKGSAQKAALKEWNTRWDSYVKSMTPDEASTVLNSSQTAKQLANANINGTGEAYGQLTRFMNFKNFPITNTILGLNSQVGDDPEITSAVGAIASANGIRFA